MKYFLTPYMVLREIQLLLGADSKTCAYVEFSTREDALVVLLDGDRVASFGSDQLLSPLQEFSDRHLGPAVANWRSTK